MWIYGWRKFSKSHLAYRLLIIFILTAVSFLIGIGFSFQERAEAACSDRVVILLDGYKSNSENVKTTFSGIKSVLQTIGYNREPIEFSYQYPLTYTAEATYNAFPNGVKALHKTILEGVLADCPNVSIDLIGYSLGGLVAIEYLSQYAFEDGVKHIKHVLTLDSPLLGASPESITFLATTVGWEEIGGDNTGLYLRSRHQISPTIALQLYKIAQSLEGKTLLRTLASKDDKIVSYNTAVITDVSREFNLGKSLELCFEALKEKKYWVPCLGHSQILTHPLSLAAIKDALTLEPAQQGWYTFHHNFARTGRSDAIGPSIPKVRWQTGIWESDYSNTNCCFGFGEPIVPNSKVIYTGGICLLGVLGQLYQINAENGSISSAGEACGYEPSIGPDGSIYTTYSKSDAKFYSNYLQRYGSPRWVITSTGIFRGSSAVSPDGIVYLLRLHPTNALLAIGSSGIISWSVVVTGDALDGSPALGRDGTIYHLGNFGVYAFTPSGQIKWNFSSLNPQESRDYHYLSINACYAQSAPSVSSEGKVYVTFCDKALYALDHNGNLLWAFKPGTLIGGVPSLGSDGTVYIGSMDGNLYKLDANGHLLWRFTTEGPILRPAIDGANNVYFASFDGYLYSLNPSGSVRWKLKIGSPISEGGMSIGPNGTLYLKTGGGFTPRNLLAVTDATSINVERSWFTSTVVNLPDNQGKIIVPSDPKEEGISGNIRMVPSPDNLPTSTIPLRSVELSFRKQATGSAVTEFDKEVVIEFSYAGFGLRTDLINRLVVYHSGQNEIIRPVLDLEREIAVVKTRKFSVLTLSLQIGPVPRVYLPLVMN